MSKDNKDKRYFRRYRRQSSFRLNIEGKTFRAKTLDYSFDGIGALVEDSPQITQGSVVNVDINAPDYHSKGKVVWARKSDSGLLIGIKRLDFPKKGRLEDFPLPDILIGLQRGGITGILQVDGSAGTKKIYIRNGDIIFSTSENRDDRLGEYLFRTRSITIEQYKRYVDVIGRTGKKDGALLVEMGLIKPAELPEIVRRSAEDIILSLFSLEKGGFRFKEGPLPSSEVITLKLSAANIIYRGIKRTADPGKLFNLLQLPMDAVLGFSANPLDLFQDIALDDNDKKILSWIDGKTTIKNIVSLSGFDGSEALRSIYALMSTRMIEAMGEGEAVAGISADEVITDPEIKPDDEFMGRVESIYSDYERLGYYGVLGLKQWASSDEIKKAYYRAAKEFHPDRHFHVKSDAVKEKLNTIFSFITAAYSTLYDPGKRKEYDLLLPGRKKVEVDNKAGARAKFEEGRRAFTRGNVTEAFQFFGQAVYLDNNVAEYHYYYGVSLAKLERFKEAGRALERAVEHAPANSEYLTELGYVFLELGFHHRAKSNFEKAISIDPSNKRAAKGIENARD